MDRARAGANAAATGSQITGPCCSVSSFITISPAHGCMPRIASNRTAHRERLFDFLKILP